MMNITIKADSLISIFPSGEYMINFAIYHKTWRFLDINAIFSMITPNKDTFG